jgi:WD repeat-containing protein 48
MYADELQLEEQIEFREDHRINLGKWVLRYLFSNLIDEEIKRDEIYRAKLLQEKQQEAQTNRPTNIEMPSANMNGWSVSGPTSGSTLKGNGLHFPHTPGMGIGLATPQLHPHSTGRASQGNPYRTPTHEEPNHLEPTKSHRSSTQDGQDYFGQGTTSNGDGNGNGKPAEGVVEAKEETVSSPTTEDTPSKKGKGMFGKKFNMGFSKKMFATGTAIAAEAPKPVVDEKSEDSDSRSTKTDEIKYEDNFFGSIQRIRHGYEETLGTGVTDIVSAIAPSLPNDTPVLKPPAMTTILIQEDRPGSGGVADLFEGKVGTLALQADLIEKVAPMWLGEVLLRVRNPDRFVKYAGG